MGSRDCGKSDHYTGEAGKKYFQWQNASGPERGVINARFFAPHINDEEVVMDFGCGGGHLFAALKCKEKFGIEVIPDACKEAEKYNFPIYEDVSHIRKKSIDNAISNHCLEHTPYSIKALRRIRERLVPRGKIILCVPIDDWRTQRRFDIRYRSSFIHLDPTAHV